MEKEEGDNNARDHEYNSGFFREFFFPLPLLPERRNSIRNCGCANLLSKYPQTRRQRGDRTSASGRLEAGGWLRLVEKADPLHLVGTKGSARRRKRGGMKEGGRKEGKDYWKIEGDKGVGSVAATTVSRCLMLLAFWPSSKDENWTTGSCRNVQPRLWKVPTAVNFSSVVKGKNFEWKRSGGAEGEEEEKEEGWHRSSRELSTLKLYLESWEIKKYGEVQILD